MLEELFQTFSPIIDLMMKFVTFLNEIGEILIFVMLPIYWWKIWKIYLILLSQIVKFRGTFKYILFCSNAGIPTLHMINLI